MIYPWQADDWTHLQQLRANWPHALLLHGRAGIGKLQFAQHLAQSLLCESPLQNREPCGHCVACLWFSQGNHPDYRAVLPEALAGELISDEKPDADDAKKSKVPSKEIKIDQTLALMSFLSVSSHRGGARVVLLYPAEAINTFAANALLKTLEEPPAGVTFILVSARIDRLLPTVISRCRQWPMTLPRPETAIPWLAAQGVEQPAALLAEAGGAPLTALALASDENRSPRDFALTQLAAGPACDAFACAESLHKLPVPMVLGWLQRWIYDLLAQKMAQRPRYFPGASKGLERCAAQLDNDRFAQFQKSVTRQRAVENHPLNSRLVLEELFFGYRNVFNA